jgi:CRP-like cAMP-binding protein
VEFGAGQVILHESEAAYEFYLILDGKVAVESRVPREDNIPVHIIGRGDVVGWSWLFPPFTWHFQARALEPTKAIFLDGARLLAACERNHDLGYDLMKRISQVVIKRLQATRRYLLELQEPLGPLPCADRCCSVAPNHQVLLKTLEAVLAEHPFLNGMKPEHLATLAASAMQTDFAPGELIFREGEIANRFYLIEHGKVALEAPTLESGVVPIQMLGDSDVLGWSWLFPPYYWHFNARAVEPTAAIFLYGTRLREQCEQDHEFGYELMKRVCQVLIQRLQATRQKLLESNRHEPFSSSCPGRFAESTARVLHEQADM